MNTDKYQDVEYYGNQILASKKLIELVKLSRTFHDIQ